MSIANQQTIAESGAEGRPLILEKMSYVPWARRFLRFLDNKRKEGVLMKNSIDNGPYIRKEIVDPNDDTKKILEPKRSVLCRYQEDSKNCINSGKDKCSVLQLQWKRPLCKRLSKTKVYDAKYFREQIPLATKDEAGVNLDKEENDFMLMNAYGDDQLEELNAPVIMMARIQPTDDKSDAEPTIDAEVISEVSASQIDFINGLLSKDVHEHKNHKKLEPVIHTSADDQIDSDIIFDDPYVENNSGQAKHDPNAHDQPYADIESLIYNVQIKAENQRIMNNEPKKQNALIQRELETFREDKYLDDIVTLEEKLKSYERVAFKMSHSLQTFHILGTTPNLLYDPNMKNGLGYQNPEHLKKAIKAQPKMYNGKNLKYTEPKVNLPDSGETLEDAKNS
ncbi:hypothetical protein Tco_0572339 [Tanacetum coccineum]